MDLENHHEWRLHNFLGNLLFQYFTAFIMWILFIFPIATLSQFMSIVSHSPAIYLGCISNLFSAFKAAAKSSKSFLFWAKQTWLFQSLPTGHTLQPYDRLGYSLLDSLKLTYIQVLQRIPDLLTFLQKSRRGGKNSSYNMFSGHAVLCQ